MSGERGRNRASVEHMAAAIKQHESRRGNHITAGEAQARAASAARTTDNKASAGALRNKRRREPKRLIDMRQDRPKSGRVIVDIGRGRKG